MKVFVGGATGATGRWFVPLAHQGGLELVVQVRPKSAHKYQGPPEASLFDLADAEALAAAMQGCDAVVSMIGTMRKRFSSGDTYASSDVGTLELLVNAGKVAGVKHFVLMGSLGTDWAPGAYTAAKRQAEALLVNSGLTWTITRPSSLYRDGREQQLGGVLRGLEGTLPGLANRIKDVQPISTRVCAQAMVRIVAEGLHQNEVVTGRHLWALTSG